MHACLTSTLGQHCMELDWPSDRELVSRLMEIKRLSGQCVDPGDWVQFIGCLCQR